MDPILPMETHHHGHNMAAVIDQHDSGQHAGHMQLNHQPMDIEQEREVLFFFSYFLSKDYASLLSRRLKYLSYGYQMWPLNQIRFSDLKLAFRQW